MDSPVNITDLLHRANEGDQAATEALAEHTYASLKKIAHARLRKSPNIPLQTTELVNEWFVRFCKAQRIDLNDREHFFRYAAKAMRSIVVDWARQQNAERRGQGATHICITGDLKGEEPITAEIIQLHEALTVLSKRDERLAHIVELRYFVGMTEPEIAKALNISERTVRRDWTKARLILATAMR